MIVVITSNLRLSRTKTTILQVASGHSSRPRLISQRRLIQTGVWPQFGDGMEFLYVTHEGENTGNGEPGSQGGMSEDEVLH